MTTAVQEILEKIEKLSVADRLLLERQLAEQVEAEWLREAASARDLAREQGIDQAAIDRAVEEARYANRGPRG